MHVAIPRRVAEIGLYGAFLVLAVAAYLHTATFPAPLLSGYPRSAMVPRLVLVAMGVFRLLGIGRSLLARGRDAPRSLPAFRQAGRGRPSRAGATRSSC